MIVLQASYTNKVLSSFPSEQPCACDQFFNQFHHLLFWWKRLPKTNKTIATRNQRNDFSMLKQVL